MASLQHVEKTYCQVEMEDSEDGDLLVEEDYEDEEGSADDDQFIEFELEEGQSLEDVPRETQVVFDEVFEEYYTCIDVNNRCEVASREDTARLASTKLE